jgi:hypothetical protein
MVSGVQEPGKLGKDDMAISGLFVCFELNQLDIIFFRPPNFREKSVDAEKKILGMTNDQRTRGNNLEAGLPDLSR